MRKHLLLMVVILSVLFATANFGFAQKPTPIKFKRGAISATVTGNLARWTSKQIFSVKVKRGQNLRIEQVGSSMRKVSLMITNQAGEDFSDMDASCNNNKYIELTDDDTYIITVTTCGKVDPWRGSYKLKVTAEKPVPESN